MVLGLGILFLPESISISSFSNNNPSSSEDVLLDENTNEGSIESNSSAESYSAGGTVNMNGVGYGVTPLMMFGNTTSYLGKDGYLYASGQNGHGQLGAGTTGNQTSFTKILGTGTTAAGFLNPVDYSIGGRDSSGGIIADSSGKVWVATAASGYSLVSSIGSTSYKAVAVSSGTDNQMVLLSDGTLYRASGQSTSFSRRDGVSSLPAATASNPIVDFVNGEWGSWVLYKSGAVYQFKTTGTATLIASNIKMIDAEPDDDSTSTTRGYMVNTSNQVLLYNLYNGNVSTSPSNTITPTGTVTQVRGGGEGGGWGYLNSAGDLYITTTYNGTPAKVTSDGTKFSFFDMTSHGSDTSYGAITTTGVTKFWGNGSAGALGNGSTSTITYANAFTPTSTAMGGGVNPSYGVPAITAPAFVFLAYPILFL